MPPPPGLRAGAGFNAGGWEPGELEAPAEHPLLRREQGRLDLIGF